MMAAIRRLIPQASFVSAPRLLAAVRRAAGRPARAAVARKSVFAAYADTPPSKKLGQQASSLMLIDAPADFAARLQPLPASLSVHCCRKPGTGLSIWRVRDRPRLHSCMPAFAAALGRSALWIAWAMKATGVASDLTQTRVRAAGLAHGLVNYRICPVDETWSALLFRVRAAPQSQRRGGTGD